MEWPRMLVRNEVASRAFDGPRNQEVTMPMGSKGNGQQSSFCSSLLAGKTFKKKHFLRLTRRRKKF